MRQETETIKQIKDNLCNIGEDDVAQIINVYYRRCKDDEIGCDDEKGNLIYNLMDTKQACDAVKHFGLSDVAQAFCAKPDWILIVGYDKETKKPIFTTEAPSEVFFRILPNLIYAYCLDPMAFPAVFREAVAQPIASIVTLNL